jgi:hypothetical protein
VEVYVGSDPVDRVAVAALRSAGVPVADRFAAGDVLEGPDQPTPHRRAAINASSKS